MFLYIRLVLACNFTQLLAVVQTSAVNGILRILTTLVFLKNVCQKFSTQFTGTDLFLSKAYAFFKTKKGANSCVCLRYETRLSCFVEVPQDGSVSLL